MHVLTLYERLNRALAGEPEAVLTLLLLGLVAFGPGVALRAPPAVKAAVIAYWVFP